jgi:mannose-6-phosphate isomerase class I
LPRKASGSAKCGLSRRRMLEQLLVKYIFTSQALSVQVHPV